MVDEKNIINLDEQLIENGNDYGIAYDNLADAALELKNSIKNTKIFTGLCTKCDPNGNLYVDINGVSCIMERNEVSVPNDESEQVHKGVCQKKVGSFIKARVLRVENENKENETIYLSRKDIVKYIRNIYNTKLEVGKVIKGKVTNIDEKKGVFVDIGGDYVGIIPRNYLENLFVTISNLEQASDSTSLSVDSSISCT